MALNPLRMANVYINGNMNKALSKYPKEKRNEYPFLESSGFKMDKRKILLNIVYQE